MFVDFTAGQVALVIIAAVLTIQTILMGVGAWMAVRASRALWAETDRRLSAIEARVTATTEVAGRLAVTTEECVRQVSGILRSGERVAGAVAGAIATPRAVLLAGAAAKLLTGWRHRDQRTHTSKQRDTHDGQRDEEE